MRKLILALILPLSLGGCLSYVSQPSPPSNATIVVPPGTSVTCANGLAPPC